MRNHILACAGLGLLAYYLLFGIVAGGLHIIHQASKFCLIQAWLKQKFWAYFCIKRILEFAYCGQKASIFEISIGFCIKIANIWPKHSWLLIFGQKEGCSPATWILEFWQIFGIESAYLVHTSAYLVLKHRILLKFGTGLLTEFKESCSL